MQAIILAAGRGTRMSPLTDTLPKPMLTVLGKNLIEWKLEALPESVTQIILIVGYKKEIIENYFGDSWKGIPITYIEQETLDGTGGAIALCKDYVTDKALVLMGDDIYEKRDLEHLLAHEYAMLVNDEGEAGLKRKGQIIEKNGLLVGLNEGDSQTGTPSSLINTGACVISKEYFTYPPVKFSETEYGLPHTLISLSKNRPVQVEKATSWIQITRPECLERATLKLLK
jgi:UDP-N-acetylglucosamine diphosphorylase / glucose-1-phosphate thymidylyltransferase / UDP-N-acetylgalactosamine diphosphorylase / glucosamine-1-phosphate N-acetyltransferase / galactosamine-1-phosphate N-acetyltransferase